MLTSLLPLAILDIGETAIAVPHQGSIALPRRIQDGIRICP